MDGITAILNRIQERIQSQTEKSDGTDEKKDKAYECAQCKDEGGFLVRDPETHYDKWRECQACYPIRRQRRLLKSSQMTDELKRMRFRDFEVDNRPFCVKSAFKCATEYTKQFQNIRNTRRNSIALLGGPGSGKTRLLVAVANYLMSKGVGVLYFPFVEGFNDLKDNLNELEEKIGFMKRADVLLLDDLFKGRKEPTEFQIEQLFGVINYRYLNNKPIMVSSEKTIDKIIGIDEALGSRIYEMSKDYTVTLQLTDEEKKAGIKLNYRLEK